MRATSLRKLMWPSPCSLVRESRICGGEEQRRHARCWESRLSIRPAPAKQSTMMKDRQARFVAQHFYGDSRALSLLLTVFALSLLLAMTTDSQALTSNCLCCEDWHPCKWCRPVGALQWEPPVSSLPVGILQWEPPSGRPTHLLQRHGEGRLLLHVLPHLSRGARGRWTPWTNWWGRAGGTDGARGVGGWRKKGGGR